MDVRAALATLFLIGACRNEAAHSEKAEPSATCDAAGSDHDTIYRRAVQLIEPRMILVGREAPARNDNEVRVGIACLDRVLEIAPTNWSALWIRGKAYQSLGEHTSAVDSFRSAYRLQANNPDVGREFAEEIVPYVRSGSLVGIRDHDAPMTTLPSA